MNNEPDKLPEEPLSPEPETPTTEPTPDPISEPTLDPQPVEETSVESPSPMVTEAPAPKKSRKGLIALIIIAVVLLLGTGGTAAYFMFLQPKDTASDTPLNQTPNDETPAEVDYAAQLIGKAKDAVNALSTEHPGLRVEDRDPQSPSFQSGDYDYYVNGEFGGNFAVGPESRTVGDAALMGAVADTLKTLFEGEALEPTIIDSLFADENYPPTMYHSENVVCMVGPGEFETNVSCGNMRDYAKLFEEIDPFVTAYKEGTEDVDTMQTAFSGLEIRKKDNGMANAILQSNGVVGAGGFAILFYGDGETWTYWKGTQDMIPCEDYDTLELQQSFEGERCYDLAADQESTVVIVE